MSLARCSSCGCRLAGDRHEDLCSPCTRRGLLHQVRDLAAPAVPIAELRHAMRGGVGEVARVAGVDRPAAGTLIVQFGLLPPRCRMPPQVLQALVECPAETNTALANRFGVSRWAIAGWRKILEPTPQSARPAPEGVAIQVPLTAHRSDMKTGKRAGEADDPPAVVVEIDALGPLVARVEGDPVRLAARSRAVLGALALAHPAVVEADTLAAIASPGHPTAHARRALHTAVWRIRQVLPASVLVRAGAGYRLELADEASLDVVRFEALAGEAERCLAAGDPRSASVQARLALACWRGAPLPATPLPAELEGRRQALQELRAAETETLGRALQQLDRADEAVPLLAEVTREHPLRELAWAALIDAQVQLRQWQDVAASCNAARAALDEVGLQPGPQLAEALAAALEPNGPASVSPQRPRHAPAQAPAPAVAELPNWLRMAAERGPFIGRETELAVVLRAVEAATQVGHGGGQANLVLLTGEAGAGKTRLAAEVSRIVAGRGLTTWAGRTDPFGTVPYAALTEALGGHFAAALEQLPADASDRLAGSPLANLLFGRPDPTSVPAEIGAQQAALLGGLTDLLRHATRERGLLLLLEDAHWASRSTLMLLQRALRALVSQPVCLLITWRDSLQTPPPTSELLRQLAAVPGATALHLGGLSAVDIATHPDLPTAGDRLGTAEHYRRLSGGNPLLLTELLLREDEHHLPVGLAAAIDTRLAELGREAQQVLAVGAALGAEFDVPTVREVAATLAEPMQPAAIEAAIDRGIRAGIVDLLPTGTRLAFHHELLRTSLLDNLGAVARAALHLAVADVLTARPGADRPPLAYQVATQLGQARLVAAQGRVTSAAEEAARLATADLDFASAATWHERAATSAAEVAAQVSYRLAGAAAWRSAGATTEARRALADAADAAAQGNSRRCAVDVAIAMGELDVALDRRISRATAHQLARVRAMPPAATDDEDDDRLVLIGAVEQAAGSGLPAHLLGAGRRPLRPDTLLTALWWSPPADRARFAVEITRQAEQSGTPRTAVLAALARWVVAMEDGTAAVDDPAHQTRLDQAVAEAAEAPDAAYLAWMRDAWAAARHIAAGRLDAAQAAITHAAEAIGAPGMPEAAASQIPAVRRGQEAMLRLVRHFRGGVSDIFLHVDRHWSIEPSIWDLGTALALANAERRDEARALLAPSLEAVLHPAKVTPSPLGSLAMLTMVAERLDDAAVGERLLPALGAHHGKVAILRHNQILGPVDHYYGMAASLAEQWDDAIEHLDEALALAVRTGHDAILLRIRTASIRARLARRRPGDRSAAHALAVEQQESLARFGIPTWELDHLDL